MDVNMNDTNIENNNTACVGNSVVIMTNEFEKCDEINTYEEALHQMKNGLQRIDKLLNELALKTSSSSSNHFNVPRISSTYNDNYFSERNGFRLIKSISELKSISIPFETGTNVEAFQAAISGNMFFDPDDTNEDRATRKMNKLIIPLPLLMQSIDENMYSLHLPSTDQIKDNLFTYNTKISIHQICDLCFETPYIDEGYYFYHHHKDDFNDKNIKNDSDAIGTVHNTNGITFFDLKELRELKETNIIEWNRVMSNILYRKLTQQIYQLVSDLDLQLENKAIDELAAQTLRIAVGWASCHNLRQIAFMAVKRIFRDNDAGKFVIVVDGDSDDRRNKKKNEKNDRVSIVRCNIGSCFWGTHYGIGVDVETIVKIKVLWKPKAQASDKEEVDIHTNFDGLEIITSITCFIRQGFPLYCGNSKTELNYSSLFDDCISTQNDYNPCTSATLLPDTKEAHIFLNFDHTHSSKTIDLKLLDKRHNTTLSKSNNEINETKQDLSTVVKSLQSKDGDTNTIETEVFAWGDNTLSCLGVNPQGYSELNREITEPVKVSYSSLSCLEPVVSVECSSCHSLLLTKIGSVYSCGDGSDGQLGHNTLESIRTFQLIDWFNNHDERIVITQISAGSDETSSHSAAIDSNHNLYTWGKSIICGHVGLNHKSKSHVTLPHKVVRFENHSVVQVSCGGGFSLARVMNRDERDHHVKASSSHIFSWGLTGMGRLGLGKLRSTTKSSTLQGKGSQQSKVPWCQCNPTSIAELEGENIIDISAGAKHALAVNVEGEIFAWGSNSAGECSVIKADNFEFSPSETNQLDQFQIPTLWDDIWTPRKIPFFGNSGNGIKAKSVAAGGIHSVALDSNGLVYSWGGGGHGDCLGHGDVPTYEYGIRPKVDISKRQLKSMSGHLRPPKWALPRVVQSLKHCKVSNIKLGTKHSTALTDSGALYVWGDNSSDSQKKMIEKEYNVSCSVPMQPSGEYLKALGGKKITQIACGSDKTICVTDGDAVRNSIGLALFRESEYISTLDMIEDDFNEDDSSDVKVDCILIAGGRGIYCHKIIIASRSPLLLEMIIQEQRLDQAITEITVSGIQYAIMKHIIRFLYTDSIDIISLSSFNSLVNLLKAAKMLKLESLASKCEHILSTLHEYKVKDNDISAIVENADDGDYEASSWSSLSDDLGSFFLQQDSKFANVQVIAKEDDNMIYAHECVLRHSSEYFRNLLDYNSSINKELNQRQPVRTNTTTTIVLPGTTEDVFRLLFFLYTGMVKTDPTGLNKTTKDDNRVNPTSLDNNIKIDLMNANTFHLPEMKAQCESAVVVTPDNALHTLLLSIEVDSTSLKLKAMNTICKTMQMLGNGSLDTDSSISWKVGLMSTLSKCPSCVKEELFEMVKDINGIDAITSKSRKDVALLSLDTSRKNKEREYEIMVDEITSSGNDVLTLSRSILLLLLMIGYLLIQKIVPTRQSLTIFVNVFVLVCTIIYLFQKIR